MTTNGLKIKRSITKIVNMVKTKENLIGKKFGKLLVIKQDEDFVEKSGRHRVAWLCRCDCGSMCSIVDSSLKRGFTKSCGCFAKENMSRVKKKYNIYDLSNGYGIGYTSKGEEFYFDLEDYDSIKDYCWRTNKNGYLVARYKNSQLIMHRIIMNCPDGKQVDHKCHNKLDNRKSNLRIVTNQQNSMNSLVQLNNKSGVTGVCWDKNVGKWYVYINYKGKRIYKGRYKDLEVAKMVRKEAEDEYFGEYSYDNSNK